MADGMGWRSRRRRQDQDVPFEDGRTASIEAERALLGGLLLNPKGFEALPNGFGSHLFVGENHQDIFEQAQDVAQSGATKILPAVEARLSELAGPRGYLRDLVTADFSAREADIVLHAETVVEMHQRRLLQWIADEIRQDLNSPPDGRQPTAAITNRAMALLEQIAEGQRVASPAVTIGEAALAAVRAGEEAAARGDGLSGMSTYFDPLDRLLGGMEGGAVYGLAGRPAMGKTALGIQIGFRAAKAGKRVAVFSLEMKNPQLGRRTLALASGVDLRDLKSGEFTKHPRMADAVLEAQHRLSELPMLVEDEPGLQAAAVLMRAKAAKRRLGGLDLIILDHLHIMGDPDGSAKHGDTYAVTKNSAAIKRIAKTLDVPVLLLMQLSRGPEGREDKRPNMSDLRQSGAIEQDVDAVMFLYREEYYNQRLSEDRGDLESEDRYFRRIEEQRRRVEDAKGKAEVIFGKVRDGEPGTAHLGFDGKRARFFAFGENMGDWA